MTSLRSIVIAEPVRTAIGTFDGTLKDVTAPDLGTAAIGAAIQRAGLEPEEIGTAVMGQVLQAGAKMNPARKRSCRRHRKSCSDRSMRPLPGAWGIWIRPLT